MILEKIPVRIRLSLGHSIWMAVLFSLIGVGVYRIVEDNILQSVDSTLLSTAHTIRDARTIPLDLKASIRESQFWKSILSEVYGNSQYTIRPYARMIDMSGKVRGITNSLAVRLPVTPYAVARAELGKETYETFSSQRSKVPPLRQITLPIFRRGRFTGELVQVGAPMGTAYRTLQSVRRMLWISLLLGFFFSIIFGYLLTRWSFKPVTRITQTAASIGIDDLNKRILLPAAQDELRLLGQTFNELLDRLEESFSRLRRFAGDVSHELRTPLAVLRGEADLALRRERSSEEYKSSLKSISTESANMSLIVEDLLLLARAQSKSLAIRWDKVDADKFVGEISNSVRPIFEKKGISLITETSFSGSVMISTSYLILAIKNLLFNACKHSPDDRDVVLKCSRAGDFIKYEVIDYGEGIPDDAVQYIFDPFYRVDSARNRRLGGAGIGLSLAKALIQLHDGTLTVDSKWGHGSVFTVIIPIRETLSEQPSEDGIGVTPALV